MFDIILFWNQLSVSHGLIIGHYEVFLHFKCKELNILPSLIQEMSSLSFPLVCVCHVGEHGDFGTAEGNKRRIR